MSIHTDEELSVEAQLAVVDNALDATYKRAKKAEEYSGGIKTLNLATDSYVIFSDLHRGARNRADDFRHTERAYNAAMAYYFKMGHSLIVLGDIEELWEERPVSVLGAYPHTFELEARFHQAGRYLRVWGNHDDEWQYAHRVDRVLKPIYGGDKPVQAYESLRFRVIDGPDELGVLFLVHGHQGDVKSDRMSSLSKLAVRYVWHSVQRLTGISLNTPAQSWNLREKYNIAMYTWAEKKQKLVLIAGHTHRPVFKSQSHEVQIKKELEGLEKEAGDHPTPEQIEKMAELLAELEWVMAQEQQQPGSEPTAEMRKPCYFNTGCGSFSDGDITGIEIAQGKIPLLRWPDKEKKPKPHVLAEESLRNVFEQL